MTTQTTGHFGNSQPYETLKPKGTVGRLCTAVVNLVTGDTVQAAGQGVIHVEQKGYMTSATSASYTVTKADLTNGLELTADHGGAGTTTITFPDGAQLLAMFPDMKFGDRLTVPFLITANEDGTIAVAGADDIWCDNTAITAGDKRTSIFTLQLADDGGLISRLWCV